MILIFKGFNAKALIEKTGENAVVSKLFDIVKANRIKIKYAALAVAGICLVAAALLSAGVTVGFKVTFSGETIAIVKDKSVFDNALNIATANIADKHAKEAIKTPKFIMTLTVSDRLSDADGLANTIIENTGDIEYATALMVDGELATVCVGDNMEEYLERRRTSFNVDGAENTAEFVSAIEIRKGYYLKEEIADFADAKTVIDSLQVKTTAVMETKITIPYETVKKTTSEQTVGYSKVTTAGCNGTSVKTESVEYINGKETARTEISNEVLSNPVNEVILVGTGVAKVTATERAEASSQGFICPLNRGSFVVTAYYGDGRNHKGIDLGANRGTPIFAVGGGTVTYAGYDSDFGYNVIVQHSNGINTRYAHASALSVSKGQVVSQGEMLGTVGSTGWSTGNHLHFEVIVNGTRVNPAPYIGL